MSSFIPLDEADVESNIKVCCEGMGKALKDDVVKIKIGRLRKKSTIGGGPDYYEIYQVSANKGEDELDTCEFCGKPFTDKIMYVTINYRRKDNV